MNTESSPKVCRGVRGATTVGANERDAILLATGELLWFLVRENGLEPDDLASAFFTTTVDLNAAYPALAARKLGWMDVPLLCGHEMDVPDGVPRCVRVLLHWNTIRSAQEIRHVYIRGAESLRPDQDMLLDLPEVPEPLFSLD